MTPPPRRPSRAVLLLSGIASVVFLAAGTAKLLGVQALADTFAAFGLSHGFMLFIGSCEVAGSIGLFLPRLAPVAAAGLSLILAGAVAEHLSHDPPAKALPALVLLVLCTSLALLRRGELFAPATH